MTISDFTWWTRVYELTRDSGGRLSNITWWTRVYELTRDSGGRLSDITWWTRVYDLTRDSGGRLSDITWWTRVYDLTRDSGGRLSDISQVPASACIQQSAWHPEQRPALRLAGGKSRVRKTLKMGGVEILLRN